MLIYLCCPPPVARKPACTCYACWHGSYVYGLALANARRPLQFISRLKNHRPYRTKPWLRPPAVIERLRDCVIFCSGSARPRWQHGCSARSMRAGSVPTALRPHQPVRSRPRAGRACFGRPGFHKAVLVPRAFVHDCCFGGAVYW